MVHKIYLLPEAQGKGVAKAVDRCRCSLCKTESFVATFLECNWSQ
ncbi:MAG: hypothetical protein QMA99_10460 [Flavobacterium sp.]